MNIKNYIYGSILIAATSIYFGSGCNTLMRTGEGFARLGERAWTGIKEDWNSVFANYKKQPYSLGNPAGEDKKIKPVSELQVNEGASLEQVLED